MRSTDSGWQNWFEPNMADGSICNHGGLLLGKRKSSSEHASTWHSSPPFDFHPTTACKWTVPKSHWDFKEMAIFSCIWTVYPLACDLRSAHKTGNNGFECNKKKDSRNCQYIQTGKTHIYILRRNSKRTINNDPKSILKNSSHAPTDWYSVSAGFCLFLLRHWACRVLWCAFGPAAVIKRVRKCRSV